MQNTTEVENIFSSASQGRKFIDRQRRKKVSDVIKEFWLKGIIQKLMKYVNKYIIDK